MSLNVRQCKTCRKLFQYQGAPNCPACTIELDKKFEDVRNYMYDNPKSTIEIICEQCEVEHQQVTEWLREGRLILNSDAASLLTCTACGAPIRGGRMCDKCAGSVRNQLSESARSLSDSLRPAQQAREKDERPKSAKMHIDRY